MDVEKQETFDWLVDLFLEFWAKAGVIFQGW